MVVNKIGSCPVQKKKDLLDFEIYYWLLRKITDNVFFINFVAPNSSLCKFENVILLHFVYLHHTQYVYHITRCRYLKMGFPTEKNPKKTRRVSCIVVIIEYKVCLMQLLH